MEYLRVKNWENFQHYKDRSPPWIKLQRDLLRDYDFLRLQDASKLQLILIWLLASQLDNKIPADPEYIKNQIGIKGELHLKELIDNGFLVDDSNALASCKQSAIGETEAYSTDRDREEADIRSAFDEFWEIFPKKRAGSKDKAFKAYRKAVDRDSTGSVLIGVRAYSQSDEVAKGFAKGAEAWLNDDRWKNDYSTKGTKNGNDTNNELANYLAKIRS